MQKSRIVNVIKKILKPIYMNFCINRLLKYFYQKEYSKILNIKVNYLRFLKDSDIDKFKEVKGKMEEVNINNLITKEKIKVGFVLYTPSMWSCDKLFKMLEQDSKYEPYIIVCEIEDETKKSRNKSYKSTLQYFKDKGYPIIGIKDSRKISKETIKQMDILFYLTPCSIVQKKLNIQKLPLRILTIYIPYSFMLAQREEKFNIPMYQLTWKFFTDTLIYKNLMKEKCKTGDENVIFCGFTRMDEFFNETTENEYEIWKRIDNTKNKIYKIIYAPHHSVFDEKAGFSTFEQNYLFIYNLAKKYKENTSWIIKPHPLLRTRILKNGFFKDEKEYDKYLRMWEELPNAKVIQNGTYFDIFKTSDTMILDSASFLAEYQYVHKPLLFLTRETQHFNTFGEKLKKILYCTEGNNFKEIEEYLKNVVINENDTMKSLRTNFFNKYLNYYDYNGKQLASEYIYNYLENIFNKKGEENGSK